MAGQKGRDLLVKYDTGGGTWVTIAGLRSNTVTINNEMVDISNKDSGGWAEKLEGAGITSMTIAGSGVFEDEVIVSTLRTKVMSNNHVPLRFIVPGATGGGTYEGTWGIPTFEEAGEFNGEVTYSLSFESTGSVSFT